MINIFQKMVLTISLITSILFSAGVKIDTAVDFTLTDLDGKSHHLFEYLNEGKWVLLEFTGLS